MATVFLSYSHKDEGHRNAFKQAARRLEATGLIDIWHDQLVQPGVAWAEEIWRKLEQSRLVLTLLSPDFLTSGWCKAELGRALELRSRRLLDVVPIVARQCDWRQTGLGAIQALPCGGAPVESCPDQAKAWDEIVAGLEPLLRDKRAKPALPTRSELIQRCADRLEAGRRLMLLAPWRDGLDELAQEIARRTHGDNITTLCLPAVESMAPAEFYAELSGEPEVNSRTAFRKWLMRRSSRSGHLVVLPYFGGPRDLVKELGHCMRGVFDQKGDFSLLVLGLANCAELLADIQSLSLFTGIMTEHVPGMDLPEIATLLQQMGADPVHAVAVQAAAGGHPDWTRLVVPEVRRGRLDNLDRHLVDAKLYRVLHDRLKRLDLGRQGGSHAASTLEKLLGRQSVVRLADACDDLSYPEVRLYYDGIVVERNEQTVFRCEAARLAAERAMAVWRLSR